MECYRGEISYCLHPKILVILENLKQISVELKLPYYPYLLDIFYIKIGCHLGNFLSYLCMQL